MINLNSADKLVLNVLYKAFGKLESYTTYKRSRIGLKAFSMSIKKLIDSELISEDENIISLTEKGKLKVITEIKSDNTVKFWRLVPSNYKIRQIEPNELYIPSISLLDKRTFT